MGARGKTLGGPEPCTIQASFRRSATTGAKHHKVLGNTHTHACANTTHTCQNWGLNSVAGGYLIKSKIKTVAAQQSVNFKYFLNS